MATLILVFKKKERDVRTKYDTKEIIINESDIDDVFESINQSILQLYQPYKKSLRKRSDWSFDSVIDHNISISKYNP